ncbi:MAG: Uma2 family endonuclease, partial [Cyanobacteriota bacterium]|nr:Uma2 family endonuclease [Cyanobacteriota bacterium]
MTVKNLKHPIATLEDYMKNPPDGMEWVDGKLIEKHPIARDEVGLIETSNMTAKTRRIQSKLDYFWRSFMISSAQGGEVYVEISCRTAGRARTPDVAYITPELLAEYGEFSVLPASFPLLAEVVSPNDLAEDVLAKAKEYLEAGSLEVWLLFPKSSWVLVISQNNTVLFKSGEVAKTQIVLPGFSVA